MEKMKAHYPIITISNFKRFSKPIKFGLKPISIFVGPNGSGKSTAIEALIFLSKTLDALVRGKSLDFLNNYSFEQLISNKTKKQFELSATTAYLSQVDEAKVTLSFINKDGNPLLNYLKLENPNAYLENPEDTKKLKKSVRSRLDDIASNIYTENLIADTRTKPPENFRMINNFIKKDFYGLASFLLGRKAPIDFLPGFENRKEILEYWLAEFEIAEKISIKQVGILKPNTKIFEIFLYRNGKKFSLSTLSSGGKQILPILLNCLNYDLARYIRQPELHLHPKLQMKLADFFVYIKNTVEPWFLIIETHSEHLIRKFQLLTAKAEIRPDELNVLYFDVNEKDNSTNLVELPLNDRGMFTKPWPNGFFDEASDLAYSLLEAQIARKN